MSKAFAHGYVRDRGRDMCVRSGRQARVLVRRTRELFHDPRLRARESPHERHPRRIAPSGNARWRTCAYGTTGEGAIARFACDEAHRCKPLPLQPSFGSLHGLARVVGKDGAEIERTAARCEGASSCSAVLLLRALANYEAVNERSF